MKNLLHLAPEIARIEQQIKNEYPQLCDDRIVQHISNRIASASTYAVKWWWPDLTENSFLLTSLDKWKQFEQKSLFLQNGCVLCQAFSDLLRRTPNDTADNNTEPVRKPARTRTGASKERPR